MKARNIYLILICLAAVNYNIVAQTINAGRDTILNFPFSSYQLGGNPTITNANSTTKYKWSGIFIAKNGRLLSASQILNDTTLANPILKDSSIYINGILKFKLSISIVGNNFEDSVNISIICKGATTLLYSNKTINKGDSVIISPYNVLNGNEPFTYLWTPNYKISNPYIKNPIVKPDTNTKYNVLVKDALGCEWEDSYTVFVQTSTNVKKNNNNFNQAIIFPNPIDENSLIYFEGNSNLIEIEIFDILGNLIERTSTKSETISINNKIKEGIYFIRILNTNNHQQIIKVIKNN